MPRNMSSSMVSALAAPLLRPAIFVEATFKSQTVFMWSGVGTQTWGGHDWIGLGALLSFSTPEDSSTIEAKGITITLSGLDATLLPEAMTDCQLGLPVILYLALFDSSNDLVDTPLISWAGRMDQPTIDVSGTEATISLNCENRLLDMNVAADRRYTQEDQTRDWPGDLGFQFVNSLQQQNLFWGAYPNGSNVL